jgi:hypothetical protein
MPFYGSVRVYYKKNQQEVDGVDDGPAFDQLVLDNAVENHVTDFLDTQFPDMYDTGDMSYEVEYGGDQIVEIKYIGPGEVAPEHVQIAPFQKEIDNDIWDVSFSEMHFGEYVENNNNNQYGGRRKRRSTRKSARKSRKTRRASTRRGRKASRKARRLTYRARKASRRVARRKSRRAGRR